MGTVGVERREQVPGRRRRRWGVRMPERHVIDEFLAQRHLAVVGVSTDTRAFANSVYRHLRRGGRILYPVNRGATGALEGDPAFRSLAEVPDPVDGVVVMVPAAGVTAVVQDAIDRGITRVWLHRGAGQGPVPADAVALCAAHGVEVVDGACPLMFDEPVHGLHRMHRGLVRRRITA
jgi:predicted CoA-binding protein